MCVCYASRLVCLCEACMCEPECVCACDDMTTCMRRYSTICARVRVPRQDIMLDNKFLSHRLSIEMNHSSITSLHTCPNKTIGQHMQATQRKTLSAIQRQTLSGLAC